MSIEKLWVWTASRIRMRSGRRTSGFMCSKNGRRRRNDRRFPRGRRSVVLLAAALLSCAGSLAAVDKLKELQEHFDRANNAGTKSKDLQKLSALELDATTQAGNMGAYLGVVL